MKTGEIHLLYEYNYWADRRILTTCTAVSPDQYAAQTAFGCLRSTLIHILDAERSWHHAFQEYFTPVDRRAAASGKESSPAEEPRPWEDIELTEADLPTLEALKECWQTEEAAMRGYLGSLRDADLDGLVRYRIPEGIVRERVLWHCMVHVVNHGTQHRSEAAALLTSYGHSPGGLDITAFLNEHFNLPS